jgi:hypothetical protein
VCPEPDQEATLSEKTRYSGDRSKLSIGRQFLPSGLCLRRKTRVPTLSYFVDKFPMFLVSPSPVVTFTYVYEGSARFTDFIRHLKRYLPLFRQLPEFRMVYASRADMHFQRATEIFYSFVKIPLESDIADDLLRYYRVRKAWEEKRYREVTEPDLIFRNQVRSRFKAERFEVLYRRWKNGHISDTEIRHEVGANDRSHTVGFGGANARRFSSLKRADPRVFSEMTQSIKSMTAPSRRSRNPANWPKFGAVTLLYTALKLP